MGLKTLDKPSSVQFVVAGIDTLNIPIPDSEVSNVAMVITLAQKYENSLSNQNITFCQLEAFTECGVAVLPYGAFIINTKAPTAMTANLYPGIKFSDGTEYECDTPMSDIMEGLGITITFEPEDSSDDDDSDE